MNKMKPEDVMRALECCKSPKLTKCDQCPRKDEDALCMYRLCNDALALLREKDATLEMCAEVIKRQDKELAQKDAEIERLRAEVSVKKKLLDRCVDLEDRTRADNVSEIKTRFAMNYGTYTDKDMTPITEVFMLLDQIAKEMVEVNE